MNKSKYRWFYESDFLDQRLHDQLLTTVNNDLGSGLFIDTEGNITEQDTLVWNNRHDNHDILKTNVPEVGAQFIEMNERKLIDAGVVTPVLFNFAVLVNPNPNPLGDDYGWHKDFNLIEHIEDPLKLWFTMYTITDQEVDSEFMVSPTPDGPEFWNIGVRTKANTNQLYGHNMNLGHEYVAKEKNRVTMLYMRWFDAE